MKSGRQKAEDEVESGDLPQKMNSKLSVGKLLMRIHVASPCVYVIKSREPKGPRFLF